MGGTLHVLGRERINAAAAGAFDSLGCGAYSLDTYIQPPQRKKFFYLQMVT
jgi:hypothetical protein